MGKYVFKRLIKSIISILIVTCLVVGIVYKLVPVYRVFLNDDGFKKLKGNNKIIYQLNKMEVLGYLDYKPMNEMCVGEDKACLVAGSPEQKKVLKKWEDKGFTIRQLTEPGKLKGEYYGVKEYSVFGLIANYFSDFLKIDHPDYIQDPNNPDMERGYELVKGPNGAPAIACKGCDYKYQIYFTSRFPFIHQNHFKFNFGESFPANKGVHTWDVIGQGQGAMAPIEQTFPTGKTMSSPINQYTLRYKPDPDSMDKQKYNDHYCLAKNYHESPSMVSTSYIFGVSSLILAYLICIPFSAAMARNKGGLIDKIGTGYINILIAMPSLAFIFFVKYIGNAFGAPDKFPHLGFKNPRSYILPIIILALLTTPSLMLWLRRFMVDQSTADYVKFAKAKGLNNKEISKHHIFRNAVIPIVNGIPASIILAIGGSVLTETVFAIPGMGKMLPDAVQQVNNNMVITLVFIFATLSIFAVFLGDILMTLVDPRISLQVKEGE